jgi:hypothetical protein
MSSGVTSNFNAEIKRDAIIDWHALSSERHRKHCAGRGGT